MTPKQNDTIGMEPKAPVLREHLYIHLEWDLEKRELPLWG